MPSQTSLVTEIIGSTFAELFKVPYYRLSVLITTDSILGRVPEERNLWSTLISMPVTDILVIAPIMALIPYYAILTNPVAEKIVRAFSSTTATNNQGSTSTPDLNSRAVNIVNTLIGNLLLVPYGIVTAIYYADVDRAVFGGSVWQIIQAIYSNFGPVGFFLSFYLSVLISVAAIGASMWICPFTLDLTKYKSGSFTWFMAKGFNALLYCSGEMFIHPVLVLLNRSKVYAMIPQLAPTVVTPALSYMQNDMWVGVSLVAAYSVVYFFISIGCEVILAYGFKKEQATQHTELPEETTELINKEK